jgi:hypothetical protein
VTPLAAFAEEEEEEDDDFEGGSLQVEQNQGSAGCTDAQ